MNPSCRVLLVVLLVSLAACGGPQEDDLVVYSGRSEALVAPVVEGFAQDTDVPVSVRYGETAQLAQTLMEEGDQTQADVFWAQDAGTLGALRESGLLAPLPDSLLQRVAPRFRTEADTWVPVTARARTLAYAPARVDTTDLPRSIFELTDSTYAGRVGWAPASSSFQSLITAMRTIAGDDSTRAWLQAMEKNGAEAYPNSSAIVQAIADGELDFGLTDHVALHRFERENPGSPVEQTFFAPGDPGNLVNVAGVGVLQTSDRKEAAHRFISHLLAQPTQEHFTSETYEYPVVDDAEASIEVTGRRQLRRLKPDVDLNALRDLEATREMMRDVGVL